MKEHEVQTPAAAMLPGLDDLRWDLAGFVAGVREDEARNNQQVANLATIQLLQDQAWQRYVANTIQPRQLLWDQVVSTVGQTAVSKLDIDWNRTGGPTLSMGYKTIGLRKVKAQYQYGKYENIGANTVDVQTCLTVSPTREAANFLPFQAAAVYLSTPDKSVQRWALKKLGQFGASREVLHRRQPHDNYVKLALGAYILDNAESIDISQKAYVIGSERNKGKALSHVHLQRSEVDKHTHMRPYYLRSEHAAEVTGVVAATWAVLNGLAVEEAVPLDRYLEFLGRECGQPESSFLGPLDGLSTKSRWQIFSYPTIDTDEILRRAWDTGLKAAAKIDAKYAGLTQLMSYINQSIPRAGE